MGTGCLNLFFKYTTFTLAWLIMGWYNPININQRNGDKTMRDYIYAYINETSKMDFDDSIKVEGPSGTNHMTVQTIVDHIMIAQRMNRS